MTQRHRKLIASIGMAGALAVAAVPTAMAKNGADDPPNHDAGDDNGGLVQQAPAATPKPEVRHHHRHHGRHHAHHARHGADDPAGHDRGDDHGGRR